MFFLPRKALISKYIKNCVKDSYKDSTVKIVSAVAGCVDCDTEFMTLEEGKLKWKKISDYVKGDLVLNWVNYDVEGYKHSDTYFEEPLDYIKESCEYLTKVKTTTVDMVLSDNHTMPLLTRGGKPKDLTLKDAQKLSKINIPRYFKRPKNIPSKLELSDELIRVLIMGSADGYLRKNKIKENLMIVSVKKDFKKVRVIKLLEDANISYKILKAPKDYLRVAYTLPKEIDTKDLSLLYGADLRQLEFIRDEIILWDGCVTDRKNVNTNRFAGNSVDSDFVQYVFSVVSGCYTTRYLDKREYSYDLWNVNESSRSVSIIDMRKDKVRESEVFSKYKTKDGYQYCFTTSSGYWLARRNGRIFPTGNSGKSTLLVEESFTLHKRGEVKSHKQHLLTFSRASARDLQKKIKERYKGNAKYRRLPQVTTIHTLGSNILKKYFKLKFTTLTEWESIVLMRTVLIDGGYFKNISKNDDNMRYKTMIARNYLDIIDYLKMNVRVSYKKFINGDFNYKTFMRSGDFNFDLKPIDVAKYCKEYERYKKRSKVLDYHDLIMKTVEMLEGSPNILKRVQKDIKWIADDEVQDQSLLDWSLVLLLTRGKRLIVVGDISQEIYKFRYSDSSKFSKEFMGKFFKNVKEYDLPINYRSTANIVEFGNLIRELRGDPLKAIPNKDKLKNSVRLEVVGNTIQEGLFIAKDIREKLDSGDYKIDDFCVITRKNNYIANILEPAFIREKIPYKLTSRKLTKTLEKKDLTVVFRYTLSYIVNSDNVGALIKVLSFMKGFGDSAINSLTQHILLGKESLETLENVPKISDRAIRQAIKIKKELYSISKMIDKGMSANSFADVVVLILNIIREYSKEGIITPTKYQDFQKLIGGYIHYYTKEEKLSDVEELIDNLLEEMDSNNLDDSKNKVRLSTIHGEKGLSARVTYTCGFVSHKAETTSTEDYNILYVQMSRAEEELVIVYSQKYIDKRGKVRNGVLSLPLKRAIERAIK